MRITTVKIRTIADYKNFKKVSLELSLKGSGNRYVAEIWRQSIPSGWACVRESSLAELGAQARQNVV
jgi:hypothetical protein